MRVVRVRRSDEEVAAWNGIEWLGVATAFAAWPPQEPLSSRSFSLRWSSGICLRA